MKKYLFIQLLFLYEKNKKDKKIEEIKQLINIIDKDCLELDKCLHKITRPVNENKFRISIIDDKNLELKEEIKKKIYSIQILENDANSNI